MDFEGGWQNQSEVGHSQDGWNTLLAPAHSKRPTSSCRPSLAETTSLEDSQPCAAITVNVSNWATARVRPGCCPEKFFSRTVA